ncbi:hypothetical protein UFOVP609_4 [uncultured Caudovirales phage]|uniref:Beta-propeller repeat protein n=1 Tax=uncultured Caudovirales phage TaxID=2100421 RepID=A0A6J5N4Z3_9CAUD|nr:hypothetical protein UFOVP609_4 [uncultured Caudovirales phage]
MIPFGFFSFGLGQGDWVIVRRNTTSSNAAFVGVVADTSGVSTTGYGYTTTALGELTNYELAGTFKSARQVALASFSTTPWNLARTNAGETYLVGELGGNTGIWKYDSSNTRAWVKSVTDGGHATDVVVDSSGNAYVASSSSPSRITKWDSSGNSTWQRITRFGGNLNGNLHAIALDASGNVYVTGRVEDGSPDLGILWKIDSSGNLVWVRRLSYLSNTVEFYGIAIGPSGSIYTVGEGTDAGGAIVKWDSSGNVIWQKEFRGAGGSGSQYGASVALDENENLYVWGYTRATTTLGGTLLKVDSSGNLVLARHFVWGVPQNQIGEIKVFGDKYYATLTGYNAAGTYSRGVLVSLPIDGSKSGATGVVGGETFTYSTPAITFGNAAFVLTTPSYSLAASTTTVSTPTLTDTSNSYNNFIYTIA